MPDKFLYSANKDSGHGYMQALLDAGFQRTKKWDEASFMLLDHERNDERRRNLQKDFLKDRPIFIYPHTPQAFFIWDGHYKPLPVQCNFVHGEGAKKSLEAYGYPNRVEVCGWPRCEVREFSPTKGKKLLFVPARNKAGGKYASDEYEIATNNIFDKILKYKDHFDSVTVCYTGVFLDKLWRIPSGVRFIETFPSRSPTPTSDMLRHIDRADIVISCETVACLAVAQGKPTLVYNSRATPTTGNKKAKSYEKYRHYYQFPLEVEHMSIDEILAIRDKPNDAVEAWKASIIGKDFDAEKFVGIVKEFI